MPYKLLRLRALRIMLDWERAHVHEVGGNNRGPDVDKIIRRAGGTPGEPWCGDAVAAAYLNAGIAGKYVTRAWAYVPTLARVLAKVKNPRPGHVVIYDFQQDGEADHTGLFLRWVDRKAGLFQAVEGNTGTGGARMDGQGDGVHTRTRNVSQVAGFRRIVGPQRVA